MGWDLGDRCFLLAEFELLMMLYLHGKGFQVLPKVTDSLWTSQRGVLVIVFQSKRQIGLWLHSCWSQISEIASVCTHSALPVLRSIWCHSHLVLQCGICRGSDLDNLFHTRPIKVVIL